MNNKNVVADGVPEADNPISIVPVLVIGEPVEDIQVSPSTVTEVTVPVPDCALIRETKLETVKLFVALSSPLSDPINRSSNSGVTVG